MDNAVSEETRKKLGYVGQNEKLFQEWLRRKKEFDRTYAYVNFATQDGEFIRLYERRFTAFCDWTTGINTAVEETQLEIAKKLLNEGMTFEFIHETTGLDTDIIKLLGQ